MDAEKTLFETSFAGFWIKIYPSRVEFKAGAGSEIIPISQISSIHTGMLGYSQITIETTGGKKYNIPCGKKNEVKQAIFQAQAGNGQQAVLSIADELLKLKQLKDSGILTEEEFNKQKEKLIS